MKQITQPFGLYSIPVLRSAFFVLLAMAASGLLSAQTPPAASTLTGILELKDGKLYLKSGTAVYYVRGLEQHTGSIAGLQNGATVTIEGSVSTREGMTEKNFFPVKLTLNGKTYDVTPAMGAGGNRENRTGNPPAGRDTLPR
jgi:hypothetical protein